MGIIKIGLRPQAEGDSEQEVETLKEIVMTQDEDTRGEVIIEGARGEEILEVKGDIGNIKFK